MGQDCLFEVALAHQFVTILSFVPDCPRPDASDDLYSKFKR